MTKALQPICTINELVGSAESINITILHFARRAIEEIIKENMAACFLLFIACLLSARVQLCSDPFHHFNKLFFAHAGKLFSTKGVGSRGSGSGSLKTWFDFKVRFLSLFNNHYYYSESLSMLSIPFSPLRFCCSQKYS